MNETILKDILFSGEESQETNETTVGIEKFSASNVVSKETLRKVQKRTLQKLSDTLSRTYGPKGSNTIILRGNSTESMVTEYSKDGNKVLKHIMFSDPIESSIRSQIVDVTDYTDKYVGDGTTSATLLSNAIFQWLCKEESTSSPYKIIKDFKEVVYMIQDKIIEKKRDLTLEDIYNICMISTNGNETISNTIANEIYVKYGLDVFIDTAISNNEHDTIRIFDGLTLDEGYSDPAYINNHEGKCIIKNPKVYTFNDPIDTPEMVAFMEKILIDNIINPLTDGSFEFVPTVIISPKISRDASSLIEKLVDSLYNFNERDIANKPPICIVTNLLGGNMDKYYDISKLCGCKMIRKYIDPKLQEQDIANGTAPTPENIHTFAGTCDLFNADGSDSKFINPGEMFVRGEDGFFVEDESGNFVKSTTYKNLLTFVEDALNNAIENSEDNNTVGHLRKRLQSLKSNYVEYMVGGITIADRDASRDLIQDAIKNCRSASTDGYGFAANFEGFRAALEVYFELEKENTALASIAYIIVQAYKDIIMTLYTSCFTKEEAEDLIIQSMEKSMPFNLSSFEWDGKVITSIQTDIKILDAISKIVTMMFTANQCLVQVPSLNNY